MRTERYCETGSCFDFCDDTSELFAEDDTNSLSSESSTEDETNSLSEDDSSVRGPLVTSKTGPILKHSDSTASSSSKTVKFHSVCIRSYQQTMGDNPAVTYGPPIQLDWDYEEHEDVDIDDYELQRVFSRRSMQQMALNYYRRKAILMHEYGFTEAEMKKAKKEADKIKIGRDLTNYFLPVMPVESAVESAARKFRRVWYKRKN